jgi:imidazolonepropionase-like amidohydrolase
MLKSSSLTFVFFAMIGQSALAQNSDIYPSTYETTQIEAVAIVGATILTGNSPKLDDATIIFDNGRIMDIGVNLSVPKGMRVIDGSGKWVTPGLIDAHSHLGVFPAPGVPSTRDGNEKTGNNTAEVWAEHAVWPQDAGFYAARKGGVTTLAVLPGSANLFGGRTVTLKNIDSSTVQGMKFPNADQGLKMACGENPINEYGSKGRTPFTRMGNIAGFRAAWSEARDYQRKRSEYAGKSADEKADKEPPKIDLQLETLADVLEGKITPHIHCYRADEMVQMIDLSKEYGFDIGAFHHAVEAYKIADILADEGIAVATWARRWGFKLEAYDAVEANAAVLEAAGVNTILHSDSSTLIQRLNVEAAMAMASARELGLDYNRETAIRWVTANPAKLLGILNETGTLEIGKMADIVLWSDDPFSIYARPDNVFIDGVQVFDRENEKESDQSDLLIGQVMVER